MLHKYHLISNIISWHLTFAWLYQYFILLFYNILIMYKVVADNFVFGIIKTWTAIHPELRNRREKEDGISNNTPTNWNQWQRSILPAELASVKDIPQRPIVSGIHTFVWFPPTPYQQNM